MNQTVYFLETLMKPFLLGLALAAFTAVAANAGGWSLDLPRLDFPDQGAEVTQSCNLLSQTCGK